MSRVERAERWPCRPSASNMPVEVCMGYRFINVNKYMFFLCVCLCVYLCVYIHTKVVYIYKNLCKANAQ